ncbi:MAG: DUF4403 family protein [Cytophagales bacterium]|nr:DUF4403 family protein [Cytophagales bacterium]
MNISKLSVFSLLSILIYTSSCKTIKPQRPESSTFTKTPAKELSVINLPVEYALLNMEKEINEAFQGEIYRDDSFEDNEGDNLMVRASKIEAITLSAKGNVISTDIPLHIWCKVRWQEKILGIKLTKIAETDFDIVFKFNTQFNVDKKWNLITKTASSGYEWIKKPLIKLGPIHIPVTNLIEDVIKEKMDEVAKEIDDDIKNSFDVRAYIDSLWLNIQEPILINEDYNLWLKLEPVSFVMTPIKGWQKKIYLNFGINTSLEIVTGKKPLYIVNTSLPDLMIRKDIDKKFHLVLAAEISYADASKLMSDKMIGEVYEFKNKKIKIEAVDIYGSGKDLILMLDFSGDIKGTVYFSGLPEYDSLTSTISIESFDFDVKTTKALLKLADWLLHAGFKHKIKTALKFPLKDKISEINQLIESSIKSNQIGESIILNCDITDIFPKEIYLTPEAIKLMLIIDGEAQLLIKDW